MWQTLRFTTRLSTNAKVETLVNLIMEQHKVAGRQGLSLYLGDAVDESAILRPEEWGLSLADVRVVGGSLNDHVTQVVTYDCAAHRTADTNSIPPSRNFGVLRLPRDVMLPPLRNWGPC